MSGRCVRCCSFASRRGHSQQGCEQAAVVGSGTGRWPEQATCGYMAGEMTCTASDGKGNCTAATGPDGTTLVVVGEGLKVGELMDCQDRGTLIDCHAVRND